MRKKHDDEAGKADSKGAIFHSFYEPLSEFKNEENGTPIEIAFIDPRRNDFGATIISFKELGLENRFKSDKHKDKIKFESEKQYLINRLFSYVFEVV